jgi:hypothetical protein
MESTPEFGNMMKVFCDNCKYRGFAGSLFCTYDDRYTNTRQFLRQKAAKNRNGRCFHYERLWWKFWVEEATMKVIGEHHEQEEIHDPPLQ